ncbi:outer membrane protein [Jannaschia ovalis]|uniref:Outer membrane beta-barrel protein n=1 Tax=Jannaschia ovalis TaxID=3038773 RepID=A0ABY8LD73_9RHOB|nr:outer membrane beta-barrel protein [Jannaschia sp. GRR-S6-38]WGH78240.1 outer membrane beta-barrel protein [Jannaschia sp. GRR-S6-38]
MKKTNLLATAALLTTTALPVMAAGIEPVVVETAPAAPIVVAPIYSWSGAYVGGGLSFLNANVDAARADFDGDTDDTSLDADDTATLASLNALDGDGPTFGLRAGYDYAFANGFVLGGRLDYDFADIDLGTATIFDDGSATSTDVAVTIENVLRVGLRGGFAFGPNLVYGIGGYTRADTDTIGDGDGYFAGIGGERFVTQNITVGAEVLYHEFDDFDVPGVEVDATTIGLNVNYRF